MGQKFVFFIRSIQNTQIQFGQRMRFLNIKPVGASRHK